MCFVCHSMNVVLMAKAMLKLGEYLNFIMEINDAALEVFHDKKNML